MCWLALECAVQLAEQLGATERVEAWMRTSQDIRDAILQQGWNDRVGAFTQAFGSDELDASSLMVPIVGFPLPTIPACWRRSRRPRRT
jgi:GH15 family glucan-1,4-alpha-glucosidase